MEYCASKASVFSFFFSISSLLLSLRCVASVGSRLSSSYVCSSSTRASISRSSLSVNRHLSVGSMTMFSSGFSRFSAICSSVVKS